MTEHLHFIVHRHDSMESRGIRTTFICKGDRDSKCHFYPSCDCDYWPDTIEHEKKHPSVVHDECWLESWMNMADCAELCGPDDDLVLSGPINYWFEDCIMWDYVEEIK